MSNISIRIGSIFLLFAGLAGCAPPTATAPLGPEEEKVKQLFVSFQNALKAHDADKIWALLYTDSQDDAERKAETVRDRYAKASEAEKVELEKALGLPGAELGALQGIGFVKTKRFLGKYEDVLDSKIEKIVVTGDRGVVSYVEDDGDRSSFDAYRRGGEWKLAVPMPSAKY